jgi:acylphosphatase
MFAVREAQKLAISGYTRNLADGRVEVLATGTEDQLDRLKVVLQRGPMLSKVSSVAEETASIAANARAGFEIAQDG